MNTQGLGGRRDPLGPLDRLLAPTRRTSGPQIDAAAERSLAATRPKDSHIFLTAKNNGAMFESMPRLDLGIQQAYLARLGVAAEPPSVAGLQLLVQRHAERVPYETLWIQAGEAWNIDPYESATRIALHGRGGYCYHMNGALGLLLSSARLRNLRPRRRSARPGRP